MSERRGDPGREPDDMFTGLRDRPTPELDSPGLWRRIEARLTPRSAPLWARLFAGAGGNPSGLRFAYGIAATLVVVLSVWAVWEVQQPQASGEFVLLAPAEPEPGTTPQAADPQATPDAAAGGTGAAAIDTTLRLDVRLVRGYDGAPPLDVSAAQALGVGGADALRDVRSRIETLLPFEAFGVVGAWQGEIEAGAALDVELSDEYHLVARSAVAGDAPGGMVRLNGIELGGTEQESVSGDLSLEPGRLYILGVLAPGADTPDLVLLIRAAAPREERR